MYIVLWVISAILLIILLYYLFMSNPFKRPMLTESDWTHHFSPFWQIYYASKYLYPVKRDRRGEGVQKIFQKNMAQDPSCSALMDHQTFTIHAAGDLMCRKELVGEGGTRLWDHVGEEFFSGDFCIGNFEFAVNPDVLIEKIIRYSVPLQRAWPLLEDKRFGRFNAVSIGNNHINDSLSGGIISTCNFLDTAGVIHSGANRTPEEQDNFPIIELCGVKIALLSYTFTTNGVPLDRGFEYGVNLVRFNALKDKDYDPSLILKHIKLAKERGADFIISLNHWGVEFEYYPPKRLVSRAHDLLEAGIDLIIGHHPHILNPLERYRTSDGREAVVLYSLGNVTTYALITSKQRMGSFAYITLESGIDVSGRERVRVKDVALKPIYHSIERSNGKLFNRLIPVYDAARALMQGENRYGLTSRDQKVILKLYREHQKYFVQEGITYL
ncbi:MAG: CapA family protein [Chitinispirillaceae bacterium]|nr:CapA family protein [Chitinispirillaceae bacterium]